MDNPESKTGEKNKHPQEEDYQAGNQTQKASSSFIEDSDMIEEEISKRRKLLL